MICFSLMHKISTGCNRVSVLPLAALYEMFWLTYHESKIKAFCTLCVSRISVFPCCKSHLYKCAFHGHGKRD